MANYNDSITTTVSSSGVGGRGVNQSLSLAIASALAAAGDKSIQQDNNIAVVSVFGILSQIANEQTTTVTAASYGAGVANKQLQGDPAVGTEPLDVGFA